MFTTQSSSQDQDIPVKVSQQHRDFYSQLWLDPDVLFFYLVPPGLTVQKLSDVFVVALIRGLYFDSCLVMCIIVI